MAHARHNAAPPPAIDRLKQALRQGRRHLAALALLLSAAALPSGVQAAVITFDDLACLPDIAIPNGYAGLNWSNFYCGDGTDPTYIPSGYFNGIVSGKNVAYNASANPATFTITAPGGAKFNLNSVYLTAAWNDNLNVQIVASRNGTTLTPLDYTVQATGPTQVTPALVNIDQVVFSSSGGTTHPGYTDGGPLFVMDNLDISFGPIVTTNPATAITATGATLNGSINDAGLDTIASFEWGTSTAYGSTAAATPAAIAAGSGDTAVSAVLSALACNTTYHYRASASNANGTTPGDDQSFTTSACLPGAPTIGAATAGVGRATVAFTPPANDGGAAITSYAVTCEPGGITASGSASPITVTGLSSGQAYTCSVTATNSAGTGPASAAVSVTPLLPAPVPTLSQWGLLLLGGLLGATALRRRAARG